MSIWSGAPFHNAKVDSQVQGLPRGARATASKPSPRGCRAARHGARASRAAALWISRRLHNVRGDRRLVPGQPSRMRVLGGFGGTRNTSVAPRTSVILVYSRETTRPQEAGSGPCLHTQTPIARGCPRARERRWSDAKTSGRAGQRRSCSWRRPGQAKAVLPRLSIMTQGPIHTRGLAARPFADAGGGGHTAHSAALPGGGAPAAAAPGRAAAGGTLGAPRRPPAHCASRVPGPLSAPVPESKHGPVDARVRRRAARPARGVFRRRRTGSPARGNG